MMIKTVKTHILGARVLSAFCLLSACQTMAEPAVDTDSQAMKATPAPTTIDMSEEYANYTRLSYGDNLPSVCTQVPAQGKLAGRPNMQVMWENYLHDQPEGIWSTIGGMVEVNGNLPRGQGRWDNACAVRMSHMFNQGGVKIVKDGSKTVSGANGDQYYYRINDLQSYLVRTIGAPDVVLENDVREIDSFELPMRPGIVLMDFPGFEITGHLTIWNGASSVDNAQIGGYRILFWDLPCFEPADRNFSSYDGHSASDNQDYAGQDASGN